VERIIDQVHGIMSKAGLHFDTSSDGKEYRVPYDSAFVYVRFNQSGDDTMVSFTSPLLSEVDESVPGKQKILEAVNDLNAEIMIGKAVYYAEHKWIGLEHWIVGDDLQADEYLDTLGRVAHTAEDWDDKFLESLGTGVRSRDFLNRQSDESGGDHVVDA
jgi:hypothetical protein